MFVIAKGQFKGFNKYKVNGEETIIYLERRDGNIQEAIIDTEDLPKLIEFGSPWHSHWSKKTKSYYCRCCKYTPELKRCITIFLARFIMNAKEDEIVDHKDFNTLNNKKDNLRVINYEKNLKHRHGANLNNKTGVRNVCYIERANEYRVQIMKDGVRYKWIFPATQFPEACEFAEKKRKELFGEFAGNGVKSI